MASNIKSSSFKKLRGRGYDSSPANRFDKITKEYNADVDQCESNVVLTELNANNAKSILTKNNSPDIPFELSLNAYRGCEHGCAYCFARPTHSYLDLSPGLDFESRIFYKSNASTLLEKEFANPNYVVKTISLGNITDCYQPVERRLEITRAILKTMLKYKHPVSIVTKSVLIERDIDLLQALAQLQLVHVAISISTLDKQLAQKLEPRATTPLRRLRAVQTLSQANVPTSVLLAPIIPVLTDNELENILAECKTHGAIGANFVMLRLPNELKDLFSSWLEQHFPLKASHILNRVKEMHGGKLYQSEFGHRMRGRGNYAELIEKRFHLMCKKLKLSREFFELDHSRFIGMSKTKPNQLSMF